MYTSATTSVALLELTCALDSGHHILSARSKKQNKPDYLQLLAELDHDRLQISNYYKTVEISVLGYHQPSSIQNIERFIDFLQPSVAFKLTIRQIPDSAARISVMCSQRIFMAQNCCIWSTNSLM